MKENEERDPLEIADERLRALERQFKNFIILGDGVTVEGDTKKGYAVQSPPDLSQ